MNDHLCDRLTRKLETLSDEKGYQVLDYVEFLESKYATKPEASASIFTRFAETVEDTLRAGKVSATAISETMGFMSKAMGVLNGVAAAGKSVVSDVGGTVSKVATNASAAANAAVAAANAAANGTPAAGSAPAASGAGADTGGAGTAKGAGASAATSSAPIAKPDAAATAGTAVEAHWPTDDNAPGTGR
ncbi:MAG: hypothetical protein HY275_03455 [Gemmatimonadetes bacterium]|nr:hypothetical protein [Gemmatimonadota bacterium]